MADYIEVPNVAEVVVQAELDGQAVNSVHNFKFPGSLTTSILDDLADSVIASWIAWLADIFVETFVLRSVKATDLTTASSPTVTVTAPADTNGAVSATESAANAAIVLSERTESRGRSFRGRCYSPAIPHTRFDNAVSVLGTYATDIVNQYSAFFNDIESDNGCVHVVVSRRANGAPRTTGVATEITSYSCNTDVDSQRNRLAGRGV